VPVPRCRNTQSHASEYGWLCIPSALAPSDAHQDGQCAERVDVRRREANAWPGATHWNREPCRCGRAQQSFPWKPQPLTSARSSVCSDRHLATGRAPHQPQTASSAASQRCQPCMHPVLLFDVAQSQTTSLGEGVRCAVRDSGRRIGPHKHTSRVPASPNVANKQLPGFPNSAVARSGKASGRASSANSTPSVDLSYLTNFYKSRSRAERSRHPQLSCHTPFHTT
jgi:hypothetical protein